MNNAGNREQGVGSRVAVQPETSVPTVSEKAMSESKTAQVVTAIQPAKLTLAEVRAKLEGKTGKRFWKHLDELADSPAFQEMVKEEFPRQAGANEWVDSVSRRGFMKVMGASFALAGLAGCTKQPDEPIFPYVKQPEDLVLGKPMYFATAHPLPTGAIPVLVKSEAFRPVKVDGNPEHPMSKGKTDAFTQASLLDLYDPDRSQHPLLRGEATTWGEFQEAFANAVAGTTDGTGVYFLSETITSPTLAAQWKDVSAKYKAAKLVQYEPVNGDVGRAASKAGFSDYYDTQYKLENADVILAIDADFLSGAAFPGFLPLSAAYAERHRYEEGKTMNRMYVVETMPTVTGFKAEHRLALKPSEVEHFLGLLSDIAGMGRTSSEANYDDNRLNDVRNFAQKVYADLKQSGGRCAVVVGPQSSASAHALALSLNASLGAEGKTVFYTPTLAAVPSVQGDDLKSLVDDMNAGKVQWLVMLGANPLYNAPADLNFASAMVEGADDGEPELACGRDGLLCDVAPEQGALPGDVVGCAGV